MSLTICSSCRSIFQTKLRLRITYHELQRRGFHNAAPLCVSQKGSHITSLYVDTFPPSVEQLDAATHFFNTHAPTKSWTASEWRRHISQHSDDLSEITPEIAFLGRSNSGKSSLLNALLESPGLCRVGSRPGKTTTMHAWTLTLSDRAPVSRKRSTTTAAPKLTVLDMPGYGHGSRADWGQEIIKYMRRRRQLRRAFLLLNPKHGVKASDEQILQVLRAEGIPHQIIACKCDGLKASEMASGLGELREAVTKSAVGKQALGLILSDVLAVGYLGDGKANRRVDSKNMRGVENVRWAILQATGLEEYAVKQYAESLLPQKEQRPLRIIGPHNPLLGKQSILASASTQE